MKYLVGFLILVAAFPGRCSALTFQRGHFYTAGGVSEGILHQLTESGVSVSRRDIPGVITSLDFGADNLLYIATGQQGGLGIYTLDGHEQFHDTYSYPLPGTSVPPQYGRLDVGDTSMYLAFGDRLLKWTIGDTSPGTSIYENIWGVNDVEILPSGNLLIASRSEILELTPTGGFVRSISPSFGFFSFIQSIEFDANTNSLYAVHSGTAATPYNIVRLNGTTGAAEGGFNLEWATEVLVTRNGDFLVGRSFDPPQLFGQDYRLKSTFDGPGRSVIAQRSVPEPTSAILIALGIGAWGRRNHRCR